MPNLSHSQFAIRKGQVFATKADVSTAIDRWSLDPLYKFALRNRRSTTKYIDRQCFYASRGCPWRVRARVCQDTRNNPNFGKFVVTKVDANHTCEEYGRAGKCETVNRKRWLDGWVRENFDVDDAKVKPDTVVRKLRDVVGEEICYDRAQAALARVRKEREKERDSIQGSEAATMAGDFLGPTTPGGLLDLSGLTSPVAGMGLQSGSQAGSRIGQIPPQASIERYTLSSLSSSLYGNLNTPSQTTPLPQNLSSSHSHHQQHQQQTPTHPSVPPASGPPTPYLAYRPPAGVDPLDIVRQYIQWTISRIPSAREQLEKADNAITEEYHDVEGIMVFTDDDWKRLEVPLGLGRRLARDVVRFAQEKGWSM